MQDGSGLDLQRHSKQPGSAGDPMPETGLQRECSRQLLSKF